MRPDMAIGLGEFSEAPAPLGLSDLAASGSVAGETPAPVLLDALDGGDTSGTPSPIGEGFLEGLESGSEAPAPQFFEAAPMSAGPLSEPPTPKQQMRETASVLFVDENQMPSPEPIENRGEVGAVSEFESMQAAPEPLSIDHLSSMK